MASEASHITHEVFGEIRAGGSSLARPRAYFLVCNMDYWFWSDDSDREKGDLLDDDDDDYEEDVDGGRGRR